MPTSLDPSELAYEIVDLGTLGGTRSSGRAINNRGWVTGKFSLLGDTEHHAFLYDGETMRDLGTLGGQYSWGIGINNYGQVTGQADTNDGYPSQAFLYDGIQMHDLGTLSGLRSSGEGLNNSGQVVGYAETERERLYAFLYTGGRMVDLNTFLPEGSGWQLTSASDINDAGWITGSGTINGETHAYLLRPVAKG